MDTSEVIGGPSWIGTDRCEIVAKIPAEYGARPSDEIINKMIQNLLADRFQLTVHRDAREVSGYALVVAKNGLRMTAAAPDEKTDFIGSNKHITATNTGMKALAQFLSTADRLVVDKTGLTAGYDFQLDWAPADDTSGDRPSLFTALQDQLGLRLESTKIPIQAVVIDRAEKPTAN